jgi:sporulation protein YlmC with PRC-barrel domain
MKAAKPPKVLTASTLKGDKVTNAKDEDLGNVEEIMLDLERGQVAYLVLSFGRANWMPNNKLFAVPWGAFTISFHDRKFILDVSKETLKMAPGFDRDKWPEVADFCWLAKEQSVPMNVTGTGIDTANQAIEKAPSIDKDKSPDQIDFDLVTKFYIQFTGAPYWDSSLSMEEQKKKLAYAMWEKEGRPAGKDVEHYFRAEAVLSQPRLVESQTSGITKA